MQTSDAVFLNCKLKKAFSIH